MKYVLQPDGSLRDPDGRRFDGSEVSDLKVAVPHLRPHVIPFAMPKGDVVNLRVRYSSHCWTERFDPVAHDPVPLVFRDGRKPRVFDPTRFADSAALAGMLADLAATRVHWTPSDRNFAVQVPETATAAPYTAFFTLRRTRGTFEGCRYQLALDVESAYRRKEPVTGTRMKIAAAVDAVLKGRQVVYRR